MCKHSEIFVVFIRLFVEIFLNFFFTEIFSNFISFLLLLHFRSFYWSLLYFVSIYRFFIFIVFTKFLCFFLQIFMEICFNFHQILLQLTFLRFPLNFPHFHRFSSIFWIILFVFIDFCQIFLIFISFCLAFLSCDFHWFCLNFC